MDNKIDTIVLARKEMENKNNKTKFWVYFAYRQEQDKEGNFQDILTPMTDSENKPIFKARPIKVKLSQDFEKKLESMNLMFPLMMKLDEEKRITNRDGKVVRSFYITVDSDRETKQPRVDKYGKKHLLLVIRDADDIREKPLASYSLEDLDNFE